MQEQYRHAKSARATAAIETMMKRDLEREIYEGEFIALGVQSPDPTGNGPEVIRAFVFRPGSGAIDWSTETVAGSGRTYNQVFIVRASAMRPTITTPSIATPIPAAQPAKPGPKGGYATIMEIYDLLVSQGEITKKHSSLEAYRKVYEYIDANLRRDFPSDRGLSYKTFTSHLRKRRKS